MGLDARYERGPDRFLRVYRARRVQNGSHRQREFVKLNGAIRVIAINGRSMNSRVLQFLLLAGKGIFVPIT